MPLSRLLRFWQRDQESFWWSFPDSGELPSFWTSLLSIHRFRVRYCNPGEMVAGKQNPTYNIPVISLFLTDQRANLTKLSRFCRLGRNSSSIFSAASFLYIPLIYADPAWADRPGQTTKEKKPCHSSPHDPTVSYVEVVVVLVVKAKANTALQKRQSNLFPPQYRI